MDSSKENISKRIDEIFNELNACRDDARDSDSQLIQILTFAATAISITFGISKLEVLINGQFIFFLLNVLILCTICSYIAVLGIVNVLRYHYIQDLEDRLAILIPKNENEKEFMHWMSFSAPITTRNFTNVKSIYTKVHYLNYTIAIISLLLICGSITILQRQNLEPQYSGYANIVLAVLGIFVVLSFVWFIYFPKNAKRMFQYAMKESVKKKQSRIRTNNLQNISDIAFSNNLPKLAKSTSSFERNKANRISDYINVISYFIYPKSKDLQKISFLIVGFITGILLSNGSLTFKLIFGQLQNLFILIIVIEILAYQARYQWNDIRGLREDMEAQKKNRLPAKILGKKRAIFFSLVIMFIKIIGAFVVASVFGGQMRNSLLVCTGSVIILSIIYEFARTSKCNIMVFILVSLGYPLRLLAGIWAAYPEIWMNNIPFFGTMRLSYIVMILLVAYAFFGELSAILPWTHEIINETHNDIKNGIIKSHYGVLYKWISDRCETASKREDNNSYFPLQEKGKIYDLWNICYLFSVALLSILILKSISIKVLLPIIAEIMLISLLIVSTFVSRKNVIICTVTMLVIVITKIVVVYCIQGQFIYYIYFSCNQALFILSYFFLRFLFNPDFDFVKSCMLTFGKLTILVIGKDTWQYLDE